ncbi:MAG: DmsC/YnfH family molybdoenzyme membrane anchor subunit [Rubrivivax sp.]
MHPGFSVILLTTLIGAGQGLFLGLYAADLAAALHVIALPSGRGFFVPGVMLSLAFTGAGAIASLFHLGHPERAWRALAMWRTSWLSREGIVMLSFMLAVFLYGLAHWLEWPATLAIGAVAAVLCLSLFICTGMIYACIKFLQEWASPLTVINYIVLGCASGFTLASAFAALTEDRLVVAYTATAIAFTLLGLLTRCASLLRNSRIKHKSTLQSATGIHHPRIVQKSQGFMGGSYNTREFFHGRSRAFLRSIKWVFLALAFAVPLLLLGFSLSHVSAIVLCLAFLVQYAGLIAERWFFFAQSNHPQNLYYQAIS